MKLDEEVKNKLTRKLISLIEERLCGGPYNDKHNGKLEGSIFTLMWILGFRSKSPV